MNNYDILLKTQCLIQMVNIFFIVVYILDSATRTKTQGHSKTTKEYSPQTVVTKDKTGKTILT